MKEMVFNNQTIFEFEDTAVQAQDFLKLVNEMIGRAMKGQNTLRPLPNIENVIDHAQASEVNLENITSEELMKEVSNG